MSNIPESREEGGRFVREAWIEWAKTQPDPKPSWFVPWDELDEQSKEADRYIYEKVSAPFLTALESLIDERTQLLKQIEDLHHRCCDYCGKEYDDSYPELEDTEEDDS